MKRYAVTIAIAVALLGVACSSKKDDTTSTSSAQPAQAPASEATTGVFTGEIMDGACAAMGSHEAMQKPEGAKDARDCSLKCAAGGSKLVLYDAATKSVYQLDDQTKAKELAGEKVKVTGTLDNATKTIHVQGMEAS